MEPLPARRRPAAQGTGRGAALVRHVEDDLRATGARLLLIETSGVDGFEVQRRFYRGLGHAEEARIRDFYAAGDDKVIFWKALAPLPLPLTPPEQPHTPRRRGA